MTLLLLLSSRYLGCVRKMMSEKWGERMGGRLSEMFSLCESLLALLCE